MKPDEINIRPAEATELDVVNRVVEQAIMGWELPERVKRLALPSYRYTTFDMHHMELWLAEGPDIGVLGLVAWEPADPQESPDGETAMLLHGIFVAPSNQHQGIGSRLLQTVEKTARAANFTGILVKAQTDAVGFFRALDYSQLSTDNPDRNYPNRYWKSVS